MALFLEASCSPAWCACRGGPSTGRALLEPGALAFGLALDAFFLPASSSKNLKDKKRTYTLKRVLPSGSLPVRSLQLPGTENSSTILTLP